MCLPFSASPVRMTQSGSDIYLIAESDPTSSPMNSVYLPVLQPMFVMTNDGGSVSDDQTRTAPVLCQRAFIFNVMARSIPIALLHGATFRDSKVGDFPPIFKPLTPASYRSSRSSSNKDYSPTLGRFSVKDSGLSSKRPTITLRYWSSKQTMGILPPPWDHTERSVHLTKAFGRTSRVLSVA